MNPECDQQKQIFLGSAINKEEYLGYIHEAGFKEITIQKDKPIIVPNDILKNYLNAEEIAIYQSNPTIIRSITVYAEKKQSCCDPKSGCC